MENVVDVQTTQENTEWLRIRERILYALAIPIGTTFSNTILSISPLINIGKYCHDCEDISKLSDEKIELFNKMPINDFSIFVGFVSNLICNQKFVDDFKNIIGAYPNQILNQPNLYNELSEPQKYQINSLIAAHSLKYTSLIEKLLKYICYKNFFFFYCTTNLNLHFENCKSNILLRDQLGNKLFIDKIFELFAKCSSYMTFIFYNNKCLHSSVPPKSLEIKFWRIIDSIFNENQRNYISQINNADENELKPNQLILKNNLNNPDIQNTIIDLIENTYLKEKTFTAEYNNEKESKKIIVNMNKVQFAHVMNSNKNELKEYEKTFKNNFFEKVLIKSGSILKEVEFPTDSEITISNLIEKNSQLEFLNHLNDPTLIPSQIKIDSMNPVENITVDSAEKLSDFEDIKREIKEIENQDVTNILFKFEEKNVEFKYWCQLHQIHKIHQFTEGKWSNFTTLGNGFLKAVSEGKLNNYFKPSISNFKNYFQIKQQKESILLSAINVKISLYPPKKQVEIICKFMSSQSLKPEFKLAILREYSQTQSKNFIQALAVGKIELNLETAQYFLKAMFELYKTNANMATLFKTQLLNNPNTTAQFRAYLNTMDFMALIPTFLTLYASYASTVALINTNLTIASVAASCYYASMPAAAFALILNQQNNQQILNRANNQPLVETR